MSELAAVVRFVHLTAAVFSPAVSAFGCLSRGRLFGVWPMKSAALEFAAFCIFSCASPAGAGSRSSHPLCLGSGCKPPLSAGPPISRGDSYSPPGNPIRQSLVGAHGRCLDLAAYLPVQVEAPRQMMPAFYRASVSFSVAALLACWPSPVMPPPPKVRVCRPGLRRRCCICSPRESGSAVLCRWPSCCANVIATPLRRALRSPEQRPGAFPTLALGVRHRASSRPAYTTRGLWLVVSAVVWHSLWSSCCW